MPPLRSPLPSPEIRRLTSVRNTHFPVTLLTSPPSSSGIVGFSPRFVPPIWTVEPGNWEVTFSFTPESLARYTQLRSDLGEVR